MVLSLGVCFFRNELLVCFKTFWDLTPRAHVCCVSDVFGAHGMERNIGDQLNKAFEAYRQVSIEKENAKKELQQMVTTWGEELCVKWAKYYRYSTNYNKSQSSLKVLHWKCACLFYLRQQSNIKTYVIYVNESVPHADVWTTWTRLQICLLKK